MSAPEITVVGSVNLDLVATSERLPQRGETLMGGQFASHPGGKGANQALAAKRLGADVSLIAKVGRDANADAALSLLKRDGVDLGGVRVSEDAPTGVALINVAADGDNQIVVAPGANAELSNTDLPERIEGALIGQLEVPMATLSEAARRCTGFVAVNLAPALPSAKAVIQRANLLVVNETEANFYGKEVLFETGAIVVVTKGSKGATLYSVEAGYGGQCTVEPPAVDVVDATGAGDTFTAAFVVALLEGRNQRQALRFACAAGALATTRPGAQPALPLRGDVERLL